MKTQIKTKDVINLINPFTEGVQYKGQTVVLSLDTLKEYVTFPRKNGVFTPSESAQETLYKNAALYIINSQDPAFISLDLNKSNPIEAGLFELIKSVYKKEAELTISVPEEGDNLLFIQSKKLKPLEKLKLDKAQDIEYANLSSVFMNTKRITQEDIKIVEKNQFFWQEDGEDLYSNKEWALSQLTKILKQNKYSKDSTVKTDLLTLIKKLNTTLIESDDFKLDILNLNDSYLNKFLLVHNPILFDFDFKKPELKEKVMQDIKKDSFGLLEILVEKSISNRSPDNLELEEFINQQETINYLITQGVYSSSYPSDNAKKFTVLSCYKYLNDENKRNDQIIEKYIYCCTGRNSSNEPYLDDSMILKLSPDIFDKRQHLSKILPQIRIDDFANYLKKNNHTNKLLSDKDFLLNNVQGFYPYKIGVILEKFYDKKDINKELIMNIIKAKPNFFTEFSSEKNTLFLDKLKDIEVIMHAHECGVELKKIPKHLLNDFFLKTGTQNEEIFKTEYIITNKMLYDSKIAIYDNPEDNKAFKAKYSKLENMFFAVDNYFCENKQASKELSKIKDVEVFKELMNKIHKVPVSFSLEYRNFYANMHPDLKTNVELLESTGILPELRFANLPEMLQYNKKVAIQFVGKETNSIPKEFFNDINFSLEFAKCLDNGIVKIEKAPDFISNFFDNQSVSSNYHEYLKSYIAISGINQALEQKEESSTPRKMKI